MRISSAVFAALVAMVSVSACSDVPTGVTALTGHWTLTDSLVTSTGKFVPVPAGVGSITFGADDTYIRQEGRFGFSGHWHGESLAGLVLVEDGDNAPGPLAVWLASVDGRALNVRTVGNTIAYRYGRN
jgi:hypothetical protein